MAADRDNPKVAHLCEPFSPALLRLLNQVIRACNEHGKPVTLCGEMAGRPRCFLPLFGMGLRRLSMSPAFVPSIREVLRHTTLAAAEEAARSRAGDGDGRGGARLPDREGARDLAEHDFAGLARLIDRAAPWGRRLPGHGPRRVDAARDLRHCPVGTEGRPPGVVPCSPRSCHFSTARGSRHEVLAPRPSAARAAARAPD